MPQRQLLRLWTAQTTPRTWIKTNLEDYYF